MLKKASLWCVVLAATAPAVVRAEPVMPAELPGDVVALVEVANLTTARDGLQKLIVGVGLPMQLPQPSQVVPQGMLKTQDAASVDLTRPFQVVVFAPPLHASPVMVFSVADAEAYLAGIPLEKKEDRGAVHVYQGFGAEMAVAISGNRAVIGSNAQTVARAAEILAEGKLGDKPLLGDAGLAVVVRLRALMAGLDEVGQNPLNLFLQQMEQAMAMNRGAGANEQQMVRILTAEVEALDKLMGQVEAVKLAFRFEPDALVVTKRVQPAAGSALAAYVASIPEGDLQLMKYMPSDAIAFFAAKTGDLKPLVAAYVDLVGKMMPPGNEKTVANLSDVMGKFIAVMGDEVAEALSPRQHGAMSVCYAIQIRDEEAFKELMASLPAMIDAMAAAQPGMTMQMEVEPDALTHGGRSISKMRFAFDFEPMADVPGAEEIAAMQRKMMEIIFGPEGASHFTVGGGVQLTTMGTGSLDALKAMMDGKDRLPGTETLKQAITGMPEKPIAVGYVSVSGLGNWALELIRNVVTDPATIQKLNGKRFMDAPPVGFACTVSDDGVVGSRARIPVEAGRSVYGFVMQMMMSAAMDAADTVTPAPVPPGLPD